MDKRIQDALDGTVLDFHLSRHEIIPKLVDETDKATWDRRFAAFAVRARALASWGKGEPFDVDKASREEGVAPPPLDREVR